jgi:hypothetical protein
MILSGAFFNFKTYIIFFEYIEEFLMDVSFHHADRGETRLPEILALGRCKDDQIVIDHEVVTGGL